MDVRVRESTTADQAEWLRLRADLWPDSDEADAMAWSSRDDAATLVAEVSGRSGLVGFAEVGERVYADGCDTSPVAFLEGWYVVPALRRTGVGASLVKGAMAWARRRGLRELASDSLLENVVSYRAHLALGFEEVERSIKYRMPID